MSGAIYPDLRDKAVVVTGGGSGIGAELVRHFARQGCKVGFIDIAVSPSIALETELRAAGATVRFEEADLTDIDALRGAIANCAAAHGDADVLVNNAAYDLRHPTDSVTPDLWDKLISVNLRQQFFCAQAVLPGMVARKGGVIINFGSISWMIGNGGMPAYTASKSAVLGLTRSLARDYGVHDIRVLALAPGWIMTQRQLDLWVTPEAEATIMASQCLKRKLVPADVARVAVFLASAEAGACTNQQYVVDGGWI
jgi:NAD(P)-dependent dehydrogenase (short-subunit alcohol dehydrogenase family)